MNRVYNRFSITNNYKKRWLKKNKAEEKVNRLTSLKLGSIHWKMYNRDRIYNT
jgi:hypothetical protein